MPSVTKDRAHRRKRLAHSLSLTLEDTEESACEGESFIFFSIFELDWFGNMGYMRVRSKRFIIYIKLPTWMSGIFKIATATVLTVY